MSVSVDLGLAPALLRTRDLKAKGLTDRRIHAAVADGSLIRLREGAFVIPGVDAECAAAGLARRRLTCVSELRRRGIFVLDRGERHIHIPSSTSRLADHDRGVRVHRRRLHRTPGPRALSVEPFDAVLQAVLCQEPRAALATLDSAIHHGLLRPDDLDELFSVLPRRYRPLRRLIDHRAESGTETLLRIILRSLGCRVITPQAAIDSVGRVDFLVDGWLIIECDSKEYHSSWAAQREDRRRDQEAARRGLVTFRPIADDVLWHPDRVRAAVAGLLAMRRH